MCWTLLLWSRVVMMSVSMITMMIMKTMMMKKNYWSLVVGGEIASKAVA